MEILKLSPAFKDYLWGGEGMVARYGFSPEKLPLAEAWVLSCHKDGASVVENGKYKGLTLENAIEKMGADCLGKRGKEFSFFPVLIKLIDAKQSLSIQVHPDDEFALENEHEYGKTEMWYILDCEEGAYLYYGFEKELTEEEFRRHIENNTLTDVLHKVYVKKGDCLFIRSGTVHAIGAGILLAEIQQNSNTTYRVYDYGRVGADGKTRPLHIEKAAKVAKLCPPEDEIINVSENGTLASCKYFTSAVVTVKGEHTFSLDCDSFRSYLCLDGECVLGDISLKAGECAFVPAVFGEIKANGNCRLIESRV